MKIRARISPILFVFCQLALLLLTPFRAPTQEESETTTIDNKGTYPVFSEGANCLFIGHSFFVPVADSFNRIADANSFTSHTGDTVFAGGAAGSPGELWGNDTLRAEIEERLATGAIELLGMTVFDRSNSSFVDYQRWIDLALEYNPNTSIYISHPWALNGPTMNTALYDLSIETTGELLFALVKQLREAYPKTKIYYINYGKTASIMKARFESMMLQDITEMVGTSNQSLFLDVELGHGGTMIADLSALVWLNILYGADIGDLVYSPYNRSDVHEITAEVISFNQKYNKDLYLIPDFSGAMSR
jgi:hypothetical protein